MDELELTQRLDDSTGSSLTSGDEDDAVRGILKVNNVEYKLKIGSETLIGRDPKTCQIYLDDPSVSRIHAVVDAQKGGCTIMDKGASNKTIKGNITLKPFVYYNLDDDDEIQCGSVKLHFLNFYQVEKSAFKFLVPETPAQASKKSRSVVNREMSNSNSSAMTESEILDCDTQAISSPKEPTDDQVNNILEMETQPVEPDSDSALLDAETQPVENNNDLEIFNMQTQAIDETVNDDPEEDDEGVNANPDLFDMETQPVDRSNEDDLLNMETQLVGGDDNESELLNMETQAISTEEDSKTAAILEMETQAIGANNETELLEMETQAVNTEDSNKTSDILEMETQLIDHPAASILDMETQAVNETTAEEDKTKGSQKMEIDDTLEDRMLNQPTQPSDLGNDAPCKISTNFPNNLLFDFYLTAQT